MPIKVDYVWRKAQEKGMVLPAESLTLGFPPSPWAPPHGNQKNSVINTPFSNAIKRVLA